MNVYDTLSEAARQWPGRPAIIDTAGSLDYQSLWREIESLRAQLARLDVRQGQGVGVRARNGRAFVIGALAALGCGATVMPIHHQLKPDELADMLARAPLSVILDDGCGTGQAGKTARGAELPGGLGLRFTRLDGPPMPLAPGFENAAFVRFTSGTTGAAKGVVLTHRAVLDRITAANSGLGLTCEDTVLWVLPMAYHFYVSILLYLQAGAAIVVSADYLAESILDAALCHNATFLYVTPMHVRMLTGEASGRALPPAMKCIMSVSSRLHPQAARDFLARYHLPVAQGFGIIEVGLPIMNIKEAAEHPEAIGRPLPGFEAAIMDETVRPVSDGETGHLAVRGPGMFAGYLSPPRRCDEVLREGWFLTGDLAHRDLAGRIVLDGRSSSVIHIAGHKVFPEEVAAVLDQHAAVLRSRVTSRPHPQLGEAVHAEIQLKSGSPPTTSEDILLFCRRRLSNHKVPASIDFVTSLDLTSSGKVRHG
jgi:long-chain acyl-CoA synthetase